MLAIGIDDDDGFRRVVHQRAVARFTVAQRFLGGMPLGDIPQADYEDFAAATARATDGDLGREQAAIAAACGDLRAHAHAAKSITRTRQPLEPGADRSV